MCATNFHAANIWSSEYKPGGLKPAELFFIEQHAALQQVFHKEIFDLGSFSHNQDQIKAAQLKVFASPQTNENFDLQTSYQSVLETPGFSLNDDSNQTLQYK